MGQDKRPAEWEKVPVLDLAMLNSSGNAEADPKILAFLQKYDPNAGFEPKRENYEGQISGGRYIWDDSLLPKIKFGYTNARDAFGRIRKDLLNPNAITNHPVYGELTRSDNIKHAKPKWWEIAAPLAIGGIASFVNPGAFAALGAGPKLAMGAVSAAKTLGQGGDWKDVALGFAPTGLGMIDPTLGQIAGYGMKGYGVYKGMTGGNPKFDNNMPIPGGQPSPDGRSPSGTAPVGNGSLATSYQGNSAASSQNVGPSEMSNSYLDPFNSQIHPSLSSGYQESTPAGKLSVAPYLPKINLR